MMTVLTQKLRSAAVLSLFLVACGGGGGGGPVPTPNQAPAANAGPDQAVDEGATVTLNGAASSDSDGSLASLAWSQSAGPSVSLSGADTASPSFTAPAVDADTVLSFTLTVTDDEGATDTDSVSVTVRNLAVANQPPVAAAGADQAVDEGAAVTLDGSGSRDPDGTLASFAWTQTAGLTVSLSGADSARPSFSAPAVAADTELRFQLTVTDNQGATASDSVAVTVRNVTTPVAACAAGKLCAGAAKRSISPSDAHIAGVEEARYPGTSITQRFHLGGFGFGPFEASKFLESYTGGEFSSRTCEPFTGECVSNEHARRPFHCKDAFAHPGAPQDCAAQTQERTWVRAFYLAQTPESGAKPEVLFITLDAVGAGNIIIAGVKDAVHAATGVARENILVGMTHSHAGADLQGLWGGVPQDWVQNVLNQEAAAAARAAKEGARTATLSYATGKDSAFNNYRRPRVDRSADADAQLSVMQAKATDGSVLGTLVQYSAHPTAIGAGSGGDLGRAVHPDYVLGLEDTVESATGATAIYYNGSIADASGAGPTTGADDYARVHSRGECLARSALNLLDDATAPCAFSDLNLAQNRSEIRRVTLQPTLQAQSVTATLPVTNPLFIGVALAGSFNRYYDFAQLPIASIPGIGPAVAAEQANLPQVAPIASTLVSRITIGGAENGVEIVTMPGEATNSFGQYIRGLTANKNMMLLGLTQNSFGYIIPEDEFSYLDPTGEAGFVLPFTGYEEFVSLGPLTAPLLRLQGYNPLFGLPQDDPRNLPPSLNACADDPAGSSCLFARVLLRVDYIQKAYAGLCRENIVGNAPDEMKDQAELFCGLLDPQTPLYQPCLDAGAPQALCEAVGSASTPPPPSEEGNPYGSGVLGALAQFSHGLNAAIGAALAGDFAAASGHLQTAFTQLGNNAGGLPGSGGVEALLGLDRELPDYLARSASAERGVAPVVLTGSQLPALSVPAAHGTPYPYPSGAIITGEANDQTGLMPGQVHDAHNGVILYPPAGSTVAPMGLGAERLAAYAWNGSAFEEIPAQVDQRFPYFLANAGSDFSVYSGTDEELSYQWDVERWDDRTPEDPFTQYAGATPDPVTGFDDDDELVFMWRDAGPQALDVVMPADADLDASYGLQEVALVDPLNPDPAATRFVYIGVKKAGKAAAFHGRSHYVNYDRDADADQWIDRYFFRDEDPEKIGSSNTGYGPNRAGKVQPGASFYGRADRCSGEGPARVCDSDDRFQRDGLTVSTDSYLWKASGRWMVREISIAKPGQPGVYGADVLDRWKGRAFQQSPDSTISVVGFEDEQVNWEANSTLLGERCGPVRCMREVWGADSGTNVTKTETFYSDAVAYRYRVRVHPIPPDGLYTSWDYNRGAMVSTDPAVPGGRYYTALRPQGVPVDGENDDVGQMDGIAPVFGQCPNPDSGFGAPTADGRCPAFFDAADPTFNTPQAFDNWEQVSAKGDLGSLVYTFELKGATSLANPLVVPYYRDDACLDDGTGDDPVQRPWPGESYEWNDGTVRRAYNAMAGRELDFSSRADCAHRQGAYASHGVHYFFTHDSDNAFVLGKANNEIDGQQWQFMVPTASPQNIGEPYANTVRVPLVPVVVSRPGLAAPAMTGRSGGLMGFIDGMGQQLQNLLAALASMDAQTILDTGRVAAGYLVEGLRGLLYEDGNASGAQLIGSLLGNDGGLAGIGSAVSQELPDLLLGGFAGSQVRAGVGVVDMTPDVGYCAGQYCDYGTDHVEGAAGGEIDPYGTAKLKHHSYGVQSRLTARAIVVEGSNGKRIVLLKSDNYLAQDALLRRVGQILAEGPSGIGYEQILHHVTHNHSAAYSSTLAAGVAVFEDAFDARFFENQARKLAQAIETAAANLKPARLGATEVRHRIYKGNIVRTATADDGTPAGYPLEYNDLGLVVLRFDEVDAEGAFVKPIAVWINWGEHPESLDGYNLHSADFLGPLERFVERDIGAPLVFSQGDVGSAENSGNSSQLLADDGSVCGSRNGENRCAPGQGVIRDWNHQGFVQTERNVRFLADDIKKAWDAIGAGAPGVIIPFTRDFPVDYVNAWVPGPLSHPYPSVSNCRTETTVEGDPGAPVAGLPDCARENGEIGISGALWDGLGSAGLPVDDRQMVWQLMKAEGLPVPDHYDAPALGAVEENARLRLQAFRLGEILLASCACEAQNDLILNLESRLNNVAGDIYDGFDWACLMDEYKNDPAYAGACELQKKYFDPADPLNATAIPGTAAAKADAALIARMRAQVHNDARGWDAPQNALAANSEPADISAIWGNFTKEEIQNLGVSEGYKLPVGIGHAGDYNGYTVSYREYMSRDSYRKALTAYGPHTADYMATRLVRMAAQLKSGANFVPEAQDAAAHIDEARQAALALVLGQSTNAVYEGYHAALPDDAGPAAALVQPADIGRFDAARFTWRGGSTAIDNPRVTVERCTRDPLPCVLDSDWVTQGDQTGEVQTTVKFPEGIPGVLMTFAGLQEWQWTANFEAYSAFPARMGSTPAGLYRFRVAGNIRQNGGTRAYALRSQSFRITPFADAAGVTGARNGNAVSFSAERGFSYPRSYSGGPAFIDATSGDAQICDQCSFRPWAERGQLVAAGEVALIRGGVVARRTAQCTLSGASVDCAASLSGLAVESSDRLEARIFDADGNYRYLRLQ